MSWSWDVETPGALRLVASIVARMGQREEQTIWTNLKHFVEEQPG